MKTSSISFFNKY